MIIPLRKKILPDSPVPADGERAALGAHLHELEDIGETELLQVALEKHGPPFGWSRRKGTAPDARPRNLHRQRGSRLEMRLLTLLAGRPRRDAPTSTASPRASPGAGPSGRQTGASQLPSSTILRCRSASRAPAAVASAATPPMAMAQRTPSPRDEQAGDGPTDRGAAQEDDRPQGHHAAAHRVRRVQLQQGVRGADEEHAGAADEDHEAPARRSSRGRAPARR